jgi:hypothetical protein
MAGGRAFRDDPVDLAREEMSDELFVPTIDVLRKLTRFRTDIVPVGSRVTCDPAPTDTDEDFLMLDSAGLHDALVSNGFVPCTLVEFYTGNDAGEFRSWRKGDVNLIVTPYRDFFDLFVSATHLAKRFNLLQKRDRIALFQVILYGVKVDNLEKRL